MDSDLFPLLPTTSLFTLSLNQTSTTTPPFPYSFAAVPNLIRKNENGEPIIGIGFNAGFFILKPSLEVFSKIWELAMVEGQPWNIWQDMEQGLLNEFFKSSGDAPMYRLHWSWNVKDMPDEYIPEAKIVHARYGPL
jgi:alpha-N-acetylglucosamine transferase